MSKPAPVTDAQFEGLKTRLNDTIHELVFACQFLDDDQLEDAANALMTAQGTVEECAEEVANLCKEGGR